MLAERRVRGGGEHFVDTIQQLEIAIALKQKLLELTIHSKTSYIILNLAMADYFLIFHRLGGSCHPPVAHRVRDPSYPH